MGCQLLPLSAERYILGALPLVHTKMRLSVVRIQVTAEKESACRSICCQFAPRSVERYTPPSTVLAAYKVLPKLTREVNQPPWGPAVGKTGVCAPAGEAVISKTQMQQKIKSRLIVQAFYYPEIKLTFITIKKHFNSSPIVRIFRPRLQRNQLRSFKVQIVVTLLMQKIWGLLGDRYTMSPGRISYLNETAINHSKLFPPSSSYHAWASR
jgi:hypothetical protein